MLDRTNLVNSTIATVGRNLAEGAVLVIVVLFLLLGNFRAALIAALVIPITMLLTSAGMLKAGVSANLMSLGALDFGLIVDGAVIIVENALRRLAEPQHESRERLTLKKRLGIVAASAREMIRPSVYGQAIIILVYAPLLTFTGVEGKMFEPMALTVIIALVFAFILSLTFVPAAIASGSASVSTKRKAGSSASCGSGYEPGLDGVDAPPELTIGIAIGALALPVPPSRRLGRSSCPSSTRAISSSRRSASPGTSVEQSQTMQFAVEKMIAQEPEVRFAFSRTGTSEIASDPMPPNATDTFVILKPRQRMARPRSAQGRAGRAA